MSSRRSRQSSGSSRISDDQIVELISKLQHLLPELRNSRRSNKQCCSRNPEIDLDNVSCKCNITISLYLPQLSTPPTPTSASAPKVLQETCNYIRNLHREVDDLSHRLSQLLSTIDDESPEAAIIRSLIT